MPPTHPPSGLFPANAHTAIADGQEDADLARLWPDEAEAVRAAVPSRQQEFAIGRACARRALASIGVASCAIPVGPQRAPRWPRGIVGSITHCRGFVGAVVARAECLQAIGFDAELADPLAADLVPLICTAEEVAWLARDSGPPAPGWPKVIFSAKEAVHKCISPLFGRTLDFLDVVLTLDPRRGTFVAGPAHAAADRVVDFTRIQGRLAVVGGFVFTCAFVDAAPVDAG